METPPLEGAAGPVSIFAAVHDCGELMTLSEKIIVGKRVSHNATFLRKIFHQQLQQEKIDCFVVGKLQRRTEALQLGGCGNCTSGNRTDSSSENAGRDSVVRWFGMAPMHGKLRILIASLVISLAISTGARADDLFMTLGVAKSTQLGGLFDFILPIFKAASNLSVHVVALDAGNATAGKERADVDALLFDETSAVDKAVADHYGLNPREAMYNDFVIVGPKSDPAGIRGLTDAAKAFAQIAAKGAPFASNSDGASYRLELRLWQLAGVNSDRRATAWYRKVGQGAAAALDAAASANAYALVDRTAWADFKNRRDLHILIERDAALIKVYDSVLVSPEKEPRTKFVYAQIWHGWLTNKHGAAAVNSYKINDEQIFFPCQGSALTLCSAARFHSGP